MAAKEVKSSEIRALTVGGSGYMPLRAGIGGDVVIDLDTGNTAFSASLSVGVGTPGEAHQLYTFTTTISTEDIIQILLQGTPN